jgi:2-phosphosulfolactate phosphatase
MQIQRVDLEHCGVETGCVVVIDVLRAFTTAAVAFAQGASEMILVGEVEEIFELARRFPDALTIGEINGIQIDGVDYGNSPSRLANLDLTGRRFIQRTTAGTQGVLRSSNAGEILATSLCCASATADHIRRMNPKSLTFVETGDFKAGWGDEDKACADLIEALLLGEPIDKERVIDRVVHSKSGSFYQDKEDATFPLEDLKIASSIDRYDFFMKVSIEAGLHILRPVRL